MKTALVLGAGGFIGHHMVKRLKSEGYWVRGVDLKYPEFESSPADHFVIWDLRDARNVREVIGRAKSTRLMSGGINTDYGFDEIYQFAADMGGAGFVFTGQHDADIMHNSASINLNLLDALRCRSDRSRTRVFYSSSACIYPEHNQLSNTNPVCREDTAYPANPDSEYGWEKLFSERMFAAYARNYAVDVRIARYHNIYGPQGTYSGGREKAPAAICRKVIEAPDGGEIEVWGTGQQTRSFLYIDDCIDATRLLMQSDFKNPINIGSEEMVSIDTLVYLVIRHSEKTLDVRHIDGPVGVNGRCSDNQLIEKVLKWAPRVELNEGIIATYDWIRATIEGRTT